MLSHADVVQHLLRHRLLEVESLFDGDLAVVEASRRNRNFMVLRSTRPCYLIKHGVEPDGRDTVMNEASVYETLGRDHRERLSRYLPRVFNYDRDQSLLTIELFSDAMDLRAQIDRTMRISVRVARALGRALATLHLSTATTDASGTAGPAQLPWVLSLHRPTLERYCQMSAASVSLTTMIQASPDLGAMLDALSGHWSVASLIHGDLKWDNILVTSVARNADPRLKIVDWEFARSGDPAWDVGSVFAAYLAVWLLTLPVLSSDVPDVALEFTPLPLERIQPAIRSFWAAYASNMGFSEAMTQRALATATLFAAARLLQTVYEHTQATAELTGNLVLMVQVCANILLRPREAAAALFGIVG